MLTPVSTEVTRGPLGPLPPARKRRRLPRTRWAQVLLVLVVAVVGLVALSVTSLIRAVFERNSDRVVFVRAAIAALPAGVTGVSTGTLTGTDAYAVGDLPATPAQVVASYAGPGDAGISWVEIPGSAEPLVRYYLSTGKNRLLTVTAASCQRSRPRCPAGGSTVTTEVSVGGPNS